MRPFVDLPSLAIQPPVHRMRPPFSFHASRQSHKTPFSFPTRPSCPFASPLSIIQNLPLFFPFRDSLAGSDDDEDDRSPRPQSSRGQEREYDRQGRYDGVWMRGLIPLSHTK